MKKLLIKKKFYLPLIIILVIILAGIALLPKFLADVTQVSSSVETKSWNGAELSKAELSKTEVVNNSIRLSSLGFNNNCSDYSSAGVFGARGDGNGQFQAATAIAIKDDDVYVLDSVLNKIQKFSKAGVAANWSLGSNFTLDNPSGIAVDKSNNLYIADTGNHRVLVFNEDGSFKMQFGAQGTGDGNFSYPQGIAVDAAQNIYVVDTTNSRIEKFSSSGRFISKWGSVGSADGQLDNPSGITFDADGNLDVSDTYNNRIEKFDTNGAFLSKWGTSGSGEGMFSFPSGLTNVGDYIYVADTMNHRIEKFDRGGAFISAWGSLGSETGNLNHPEGIAVDTNGQVYVVDSGNFRIQKYNYSYCFANNLAAGQSLSGNMATDQSGNVYAVDSLGKTIRKMDSAGNLLDSWPKSNATYSFGLLKGISIDKDGNVYTVDGTTNILRVLDSSGSSVRSSINLSAPIGVAADNSGNSYVADSGTHSIKKIASSGGVLSTITGPDDAKISTPTAVAVDNNNLAFYVADSTNNRIEKFALNGTFVTKWGTAGNGNGQFNSPSNLTVDYDGNVYVLDSGNKRVQVFSPDGIFLTMINGGGLINPAGITIGKGGDILISDIANQTIKQYSKTVNFQTTGTATFRKYDSGMNGTVWKSIDWHTLNLPAGSSVKARVKAADDLTQLDNSTSWTNYVTGNDQVLSLSNNSIPYGRYADLEITLTSDTNQSTPVVDSVSVTYHDFLSGIVYGDNNTPVPAGVKVILMANNVVKTDTLTDKNGRYHFGNIGLSLGDNVKIYLDSLDYAGATTIKVTNKENYNLNIYGRNVPKPVDPVNPTPSPQIVPTPSTPTPAAKTPFLVTVYRLKNIKTLSYMYTSFDSEKNAAVKSKQWKLEGTMGRAYTGQVDGTSAVYRLYDKKYKHYLYTTSEFEKNSVLVGNKNYVFEGVSFYAYVGSAQNTKPVYRLYYYYSGGVHFYTVSASEKNALKKKFWLWRDEGIAFYLVN